MTSREQIAAKLEETDQKLDYIIELLKDLKDRMDHIDRMDHVDHIDPEIGQELYNDDFVESLVNFAVEHFVSKDIKITKESFYTKYKEINGHIRPSISTIIERKLKHMGIVGIKNITERAHEKYDQSFTIDIPKNID
jgi:hypothetical protein